MEQLTPILLDAAAKGAVLLVLALGVSLLLRRTAAATRHLVWLLAAAGALVLPVFSVTLPGWRVLPGQSSQAAALAPVPSVQPHAAEPPMATAGPAAPQASDSPRIPGVPSHAAAPTPSAGVPVSAGAPVPAATDASSAAAHAPVRWWRPLLDHWRWWLAVVWLAGAGGALVPRLLGTLSLAWLSRRSEVLDDPAWQRLLARCRRELGLRREVVLLVSDARTMPMTWGCLPAVGPLPGAFPGVFPGPRVLLPAEAEAWPRDRRRAVLLHELAHVKRRDCLSQLIAQLACCVHWFNPLIWLASHRMLIERERACDDRVLEAGERPSDYAQHLLEVARATRSPLLTGGAGIAMARRSAMEGRLLAVLDEKRSRRALSRTAVALAAALLAAVVVPVAMLEAGEGSEGVAAQPQDETDAAQPFVAHLLSGVTVELLGLAPHPSADETWWDPSGNPLAAPPDGLDDAVYSSRERRALERILRIRGVHGERPSVTSRLGGASTLIQQDDEHRWISAFGVPADQQTADMRFGIATGPWATVAESGADTRSSSSGVHGNFAFSGGALHPEGGAVVTVMHDVTESAYRVVAITDDGRTVAGRGGSSGAGGFLQTTARFPNLLLERIERFEFQTRPYEWVEFHNVSLKPGHETDMEVEVMNAKPEAAPDAQHSTPGDGRTPPDRAARLVEQRMKQVREALLQIHVYVNEHDQWPATLEPIRPHLGDAAWLDQFTYHRPDTDPRQTDLPHHRLLVEAQPLLQGHRIVGFADGHVELVEVGQDGLEQTGDAAPRPASDLEPLLADVHEGKLRLRSPQGTIVAGPEGVELTNPMGTITLPQFISRQAGHGIVARDRQVTLESPEGEAVLDVWQGQVRLRSATGEVVAEQIRLDPHTRRVEADEGSAPEALRRRMQSDAGAAQDREPARASAVDGGDGRLAFRIAPTRETLGQLAAATVVRVPKDLAVDEVVAQAKQALAAKGPGALRGEWFAWYPVRERVLPQNTAMITAEHDGRTYLLLAERAPLVMRADAEGDEPWRIVRVSASRDGQGRPSVGVELDERGGELMRQLSGGHVGQPLAVLVDGEVQMAPTLQSRIDRKLTITGNFSDEEVDQLVQHLQPAAAEPTESTEEPEPPAEALPGEDATFRWPIETHEGARLTHGVVMLRADGTIAEHVGGGANNGSRGMPHTIELRVGRVDDRLEVTMVQQWASGSATGTVRTAIPQADRFHVRAAPSGQPLRLSRSGYRVLWEGRWMRDGEVVKTVRYAARLRDPDEPGTFVGREAAAAASAEAPSAPARLPKEGAVVGEHE